MCSLQGVLHYPKISHIKEKNDSFFSFVIPKTCNLNLHKLRNLHTFSNTCSTFPSLSHSISPYATIFNRLRALQLNADVRKVLLPSKWSYSGGASYAIYSAVSVSSVLTCFVFL